MVTLGPPSLRPINGAIAIRSKGSERRPKLGLTPGVKSGGWSGNALLNCRRRNVDINLSSLGLGINLWCQYTELLAFAMEFIDEQVQIFAVVADFPPIYPPRMSR